MKEIVYAFLKKLTLIQFQADRMPFMTASYFMAMNFPSQAKAHLKSSRTFRALFDISFIIELVGSELHLSLVMRSQDSLSPLHVPD